MNQQRGIELWAKIAQVINEESLEGPISKNCHRLWRGYLNKWTNSEWLDILAAVSELQEQQPKLFQKFHNQALAEAAMILVKEHKLNPRCLDTKEHRQVYWRFVMSLRELWNKVEAELQEPQNLFEA